MKIEVVAGFTNFQQQHSQLTSPSIKQLPRAEKSARVVRYLCGV